MKEIIYTCTSCGQVHTEWPALTYLSPTNYDLLSAEDKETIGQLSNDLCVITHPGQTDRFIRCTLTQKVIDHCQDLEYGVWVSLSEKNFQDYSDNFDNDQHITTYFGWLCNALPDYDFSTGSVPTTVRTREGDLRPEIVPHKDFVHAFVDDYYRGITEYEAEKRIHNMLQAVQQPDTNTQAKKPWWKVW